MALTRKQKFGFSFLKTYYINIFFKKNIILGQNSPKRGKIVVEFLLGFVWLVLGFRDKTIISPFLNFLPTKLSFQGLDLGLGGGSQPLPKFEASN